MRLRPEVPILSPCLTSSAASYSFSAIPPKILAQFVDSSANKTKLTKNDNIFRKSGDSHFLYVNGAIVECNTALSNS